MWNALDAASDAKRLRTYAEAKGVVCEVTADLSYPSAQIQCAAQVIESIRPKSKTQGSFQQLVHPFYPRFDQPISRLVPRSTNAVSLSYLLDDTSVLRIQAAQITLRAAARNPEALTQYMPTKDWRQLLSDLAADLFFADTQLAIACLLELGNTAAVQEVLAAKIKAAESNSDILRQTLRLCCFVMSVLQMRSGNGASLTLSSELEAVDVEPCWKTAGERPKKEDRADPRTYLWGYRQRLEEMGQLSQLTELCPAMDMARFLTDPQYRESLIIELCSQRGREVISMATELANRYSIEVAKVHMGFVVWLFTQKGRDPDSLHAEIDPIEKELLHRPDLFAMSLLEQIYPTIAGTDLGRLSLLCELLHDCSLKGTDIEALKPDHPLVTLNWGSFKSLSSFLQELSKLNGPLDFSTMFLTADSTVARNALRAAATNNSYAGLSKALHLQPKSSKMAKVVTSSLLAQFEVEKRLMPGEGRKPTFSARWAACEDLIRSMDQPGLAEMFATVARHRAALGATADELEQLFNHSRTDGAKKKGKKGAEAESVGATSEAVQTIQQHLSVVAKLESKGASQDIIELVNANLGDSAKVDGALQRLFLGGSQTTFDVIETVLCSFELLDASQPDPLLAWIVRIIPDFLHSLNESSALAPEVENLSRSLSLVATTGSNGTQRMFAVIDAIHDFACNRAQPGAYRRLLWKMLDGLLRRHSPGGASRYANQWHASLYSVEDLATAQSLLISQDDLVSDASRAAAFDRLLAICPAAATQTGLTALSELLQTWGSHGKPATGDPVGRSSELSQHGSAAVLGDSNAWERWPSEETSFLGGAKEPEGGLPECWAKLIFHACSCGTGAEAAVELLADGGRFFLAESDEEKLAALLESSSQLCRTAARLLSVRHASRQSGMRDVLSALKSGGMPAKDICALVVLTTHLGLLPLASGDSP